MLNVGRVKGRSEIAKETVSNTMRKKTIRKRKEKNVGIQFTDRLGYIATGIGSDGHRYYKNMKTGMVGNWLEKVIQGT